MHCHANSIFNLKLACLQVHTLIDLMVSTKFQLTLFEEGSSTLAAADKEMNRHQCFFLLSLHSTQLDGCVCGVCRSPVIAFKRAFDE